MISESGFHAALFLGETGFWCCPILQVEIYSQVKVPVEG
jgi:hypothetical protein